MKRIIIGIWAVGVIAFAFGVAFTDPIVSPVTVNSFKYEDPGNGKFRIVEDVDRTVIESRIKGWEEQLASAQKTDQAIQQLILDLQTQIAEAKAFLVGK